MSLFGTVAAGGDIGGTGFSFQGSSSSSSSSAAVVPIGSSNSAMIASTVRSYRDTTAIIQDPAMGRCLVATTPLQPGDIVFTEKAFIYSTYDGRNPHEQELFRHSFPRIIIDNLNEIINELSNLNRVQSSDTAKNFLLLLAFHKLRTIGRNDLILKYYLRYFEGNTADPTALQQQVIEMFQLFDQLDGANLSECIADIKSIQSDYPKLIQSDIISVEFAAKLLSIVTTNQLELEELGGSGLFVYTAIIEHNCQPNCSYTTDGIDLFMTAIAPIAAGERLSIDYLNGYYTPTTERQESCLETYNFKCSCPLCVGPDRKRSYKCCHCPSGMYFAIGSSLITDTITLPTGVPSYCCTNCTACHAYQPKEHIERCYLREQQLLYTPPTTLAQYTQFCQEGLLHETHYLFFNAIEEIYLRLSTEGRNYMFDTFGSGIGIQGALQQFSDALSALKICISLLDFQLPPIHHEKIVYLDRLGQLAVAIGDHQLAKDAFIAAYQHSVLCCGLHVPATVNVQLLAANPPTTLAELLEHYRSKEPTATEDWEDMDDADDGEGN